MAENTPDVSTDPQVQEQAQQQQGQRKVPGVRVDDKELTSAYTNAFRTNTSADEVILDLGMNTMAAGRDKTTEIHFKVNQRVIMNYYTAKRMAMMLAQVVRRHEDQFGDVQLNAADRAKKK